MLILTDNDERTHPQSVTYSELYEPGARQGQQHLGLSAPARGQPVSDADPMSQHTKDSWRGKSASGNLAHAPSLPETDLSFQQRKDNWRGKPVPQSSGADELKACLN